MAIGRGELATEYGTALAGESLTVYARNDLGYSPLSPTEQICESVECNHVLEYQEFHIFKKSGKRKKCD